MSHLIELIQAFIPHIPSEQEQDEAYLNESVDRADVERRILEIDHRHAHEHGSAMGGAIQ